MTYAADSARMPADHVHSAAMASTGGGTYPRVMLSDARLKTDIKRVGTSPTGLGIYQFRYKGHPEVFQGAMAQDVARHAPQAVSRHETGYLMVDYRQIDITPRLLP